MTPLTRAQIEAIGTRKVGDPKLLTLTERANRLQHYISSQYIFAKTKGIPKAVERARQAQDDLNAITAEIRKLRALTEGEG